MRFPGGFRRSAVDPVPNYEHPVLGHMEWSEESESWTGRLGLEFRIAYEYEATPTKKTLNYAAGILSDALWLDQTLETIKSRALRIGGTSSDEINALTIGTMSFHGGEQLSILLFEGDRQPWWVADIEGREILGVTLDT